MVALSKLSKEQYALAIHELKRHYAEEKVQAGTWLKEEAEQKSEESFQTYLPNGQETEGHYFLAIELEGNDIGYFWYRYQTDDPQKEAFIFNFTIWEEYRGKGYGKLALKELETHVKLQGVKKISLHVFGHNKRAIHIYESLLFNVTDVNMSKYL